MTHNSIHAIFTWLYKNYGFLPSKIVREKKMELFNTPLDLDAPLLMFFEEIEDFRILSKSAKITETDAQIMDMIWHYLFCRTAVVEHQIIIFRLQDEECLEDVHKADGPTA